MRILITGGAGFIGSCFVRQTAAEHPSYSITNLDKLTYAGNLENLAALEGSANYQFVRGDICDPVLMEKLCAGQDAIVHFAAESHVDRSIVDAQESFETN